MAQVTAEASMLSDGSNPEGVALAPPLGWTSRSDLTDLVLYGNLNSNSTMKVRAFFIYHKVPFTHKLDPPPVKGTPYDKVPILVKKDRRINDSFFILQEVSKALGVDFDHEWETKMTYSLQPSLFLYMSGEDAYASLTHETTGVMGLPSFMSCCLSGIAKGIMVKMADKTKKNVGEPRFQKKAPTDLCAEFAKAKGAQKFFGGDAAPGHVDLSLYGIMCHYYVNGFKIATDAIDGTGLQDWFRAMEDHVPSKVLVSKKTDFTDLRP